MSSRTFASLVVFALSTAGCAAMSSAPPPEVKQRAQEDAHRFCGYSVRTLKQTFCSSPPTPVPRAYVDNAKSARNSLVPQCPNDLAEVDACIASLEAHE